MEKVKKLVKLSHPGNRITIPKEIIEALGLVGQSAFFELEFDGEKITLVPKYVVEIKKIPYKKG